MISGFFAFMILSVILFQQANISFVIVLLLMGACFIHSVLSLYLQRSLLFPEIPLKENTPGGIQIMGVIALIFSIFMLMMAMALINISESDLAKFRELMVNKEEQQVITRENVRAVGKMLLVPSIIFILNVVVSFRFLRQWRQQQISSHKEQEEE